jgi:hypothetical protein
MILSGYGNLPDLLTYNSQELQEMSGRKISEQKGYSDKYAVQGLIIC